MRSETWFLFKQLIQLVFWDWHGPRPWSCELDGHMVQGKDAETGKAGPLFLPEVNGKTTKRRQHPISR